MTSPQSSTPDPVLTAGDRTLTVPAGMIVRTARVPIHEVRLACRDRMAVGDVEAAYRRSLQLGEAQPWPPPVGAWQDVRFVIFDGRHEYVAALMLGCTHILVAWLDEARGWAMQRPPFRSDDWRREAMHLAVERDHYREGDRFWRLAFCISWIIILLFAAAGV